jgi:hypothetical protein
MNMDTVKKVRGVLDTRHLAFRGVAGGSGRRRTGRKLTLAPFFARRPCGWVRANAAGGIKAGSRPLRRVHRLCHRAGAARGCPPASLLGTGLPASPLPEEVELALNSPPALATPRAPSLTACAHHPLTTTTATTPTPSFSLRPHHRSRSRSKKPSAPSLATPPPTWCTRRPRASTRRSRRTGPPWRSRPRRTRTRPWPRPRR